MAVGFSKSNLRKASGADGGLASLAPVNLDRAADLRNSMIPCRSVREYQAEITKLWDHARQSFLLIGRYLNDAKDRLEHGEFERLMARELPFSKSQAFQFRAIAAMIDGGRLVEEELPSSASIAYELSKLEPVDLQEARERGLLAGAVTRTQIRAWKREKTLAGFKDVSSQSRRLLKDALVRRIARLEEELRKAREELMKIDA